MQFYNFHYPLVSGALIIAIFLCIIHVVYSRFFKEFPVSGLSGSVIMALALYVGECLPQYSLPEWVIKLAMFQVTALWIYGGFSLLNNFFLKELAGNQPDRFGLSAWIAATVLVVEMINNISPLAYGAILLLIIFASFLWLKYAILVLHAFSNRLQANIHEHVSVLLLLGPVATACLASAPLMLFQGKIALLVCQLLIVTSLILYLVIFWMVARQYASKRYHLLANWGAEGSLIFGATAAIGVTILKEKAFQPWFVEALWYWSIGTVFFIAILDVGHTLLKILMKGVSKLLVYNVKQWLRIFNYSILYIFSKTYYENFSDYPLADLLAKYGLHVVSLLVIIQIFYILYVQGLTRHELR